MRYGRESDIVYLGVLSYRERCEISDIVPAPIVILFTMLDGLEANQLITLFKAVMMQNFNLSY